MDQNPSIAARSQEQALLARLQQVPLFARLSSRHLQLLRKVARPRPLGAGEVLSAAGSANGELFVLLKGRLRCLRDEVELGEVTPIATVGEVALLSGQPQEEQIISAEEGLALAVPGEMVRLLLSRDLDLYQRLARNAIASLSALLVAGNEAQSRLAAQRQALQVRLDEAQHELNDAHLLRSMRG
ncbi:MAG: cyclic nucleotide-binding domain-containing protein [Gemmatimonadota bacterium]